MKRLAKILVGLVVAVLLVWLLFTIVFPWVDRMLIADPTLDAAPAPVDPAAFAPVGS